MLIEVGRLSHQQGGCPFAVVSPMQVAADSGQPSLAVVHDLGNMMQGSGIADKSEMAAVSFLQMGCMIQLATESSLGTKQLALPEIAM